MTMTHFKLELSVVMLTFEHLTVPIYSQMQASLREMCLAAARVILIENRAHTEIQRWKWLCIHLHLDIFA